MNGYQGRVVGGRGGDCGFIESVSVLSVYLRSRIYRYMIKLVFWMLHGRAAKVGFRDVKLWSRHVRDGGGRLVETTNKHPDLIVASGHLTSPFRRDGFRWLYNNVWENKDTFGRDWISRGRHLQFIVGG